MNHYTAVAIDNTSTFFNEHVNQAVPSTEEMEKCGRCCKWLSRRRNTLVCSITIFVGVLAATAVFMLLVVVSIGVGNVAKGVKFYGPFRMPWHSEMEYRAAVLRSLDDVVVLENGVRVEHVVQPQAMMDSVESVLLLLRELENSKMAAVQGINEISVKDVERGYLPWRPFELGPRANFTLAHMEQLVRQQHKTSPEETCVCFKSYQLPYDAVYLVASDEFLYQPSVLSESDVRVRVKRDCHVHRLVQHARRLDATSDMEWLTTSVSGKVAYVTSDAKLRRTLITSPQFPCIKHCLTLFDANEQ